MLPVCLDFVQTLDAKKIRYTHEEATEDRKEFVRIVYNGEHGNEITFLFFFDADGTTAAIRVFSLCKAPDDKLMDMFVLLNSLNAEYRWVKFYLDEDNEVTVSGDAVITPDTAGDELTELLFRYLDVIGDVYPRMMKVIWA